MSSAAKKPLVGFNKSPRYIHGEKLVDFEQRVDQLAKRRRGGQETFQNGTFIRSMGTTVLKRTDGRVTIVPYMHTQVSNSSPDNGWSGPAWNAYLDLEDAKTLVGLLLRGITVAEDA